MYRMVVIRKNLSVEQGDRVLYPDIRYFFYITNDRTLSAEDVVFSYNVISTQDSRECNHWTSEYASKIHRGVGVDRPFVSGEHAHQPESLHSEVAHMTPEY